MNATPATSAIPASDFCTIKGLPPGDVRAQEEEVCPPFPPPQLQPIPTLSEWSLIGLAFVVLIVALRKLKGGYFA